MFNSVALFLEPFCKTFMEHRCVALLYFLIFIQQLSALFKNAQLMVLQLIFAWKIMPETKGKTLEHIQKDLELGY